MIEKNVEKQFIPQQETLSPTPQGVEIEEGSSAASLDLNKEITSQPVLEQSPSVIVSPKSVPPKPATPDSKDTTGDRWNEVIESKQPGVAPIVL